MVTRVLTTRQGASKERGAAMVEFALVSVALFTIILGLIEGGLLVRSRGTIDNATADAARRGAIAADDPLADWLILQQLRTRGAHTSASINYIVVYRADDGTALPSQACQDGITVPDECNVYSRLDMDLPSGSFGCINANLDMNWCPIDRETGSNSFEYVGVWVDATYGGFTSTFDLHIVANTALPIEAGGL
jgi:hypothetical protein